MALSDAAKKQAQRKREKELGVVNVNIKLSAKDNEQLSELCNVRGGVRGPYDKDEYIATLIRRDAEKLENDLFELKCDGCTLKLPDGCGGVCKGQSDCYHTLSYRKLML
jgi:hypothetical protein